MSVSVSIDEDLVLGLEETKHYELWGTGVGAATDSMQLYNATPGYILP